VVPCYSIWQKFYYGIGLKLYDLLAGKYRFGKSRIVSRKETRELIPNISAENLQGGVIYQDGQFDDTRLLIDLLRTSSDHGACVLNYAKVTGLSKNGQGMIDAVQFECARSGEIYTAGAKIVINATGVFSDRVRNLSDKTSTDIITPSQGIHLVFDRSFLGGEDAIMIPKTSDGRVLFAIPWHGKTLIGTTDTPIENLTLEPKPLEEEIEFILKTCRQYLRKPPNREDILSVFAGIRPLVGSSGVKNTASLSRGHTIAIDDSNLVTLTGGKWTTYRNMAEDTISKAIGIGGMKMVESTTREIEIKNRNRLEIKSLIAKDPALAEKLHPDFEYQKADVINSIRNEMAITIEDILARRTRILFLDARAALKVSRDIANIIAEELDLDHDQIELQLSEFEALAKRYLV
ncbi:MAG: FAD-dependent oxidoreductase, partial [Pyrinomonadaceae bacterium]|nr:FAD-dependent oxidoreductase [Pyrinomonadaceae bacterium]